MDNMQNGQRGPVLDCTKNPEHITCRGLLRSEPKFRGHDGGSYDASKEPYHLHSRNVIGHAPGTKGLESLSAAADEGRMARGRYRSLPASETGAGYSTPGSGEVRLNAGVTAAEHKPVHDEYPTPIETLMTISPSGAALIAKEIVDVGGPRANGYNYGGGNTTLPDVYFDGVRMETTLNRMLQEMSGRAWKLTTAVRNVRLAETATEKALAEQELKFTMQATLSEFPHLKVAVMVDEIISTIDEKLPEPNGYTPNMGLHHFMHPIRKALKALQSFIRQSV